MGPNGGEGFSLKMIYTCLSLETKGHYLSDPTLASFQGQKLNLRVAGSASISLTLQLAQCLFSKLHLPSVKSCTIEYIYIFFLCWFSFFEVGVGAGTVY